MNRIVCIIIFALALALLTSCAYRYYLGMHGPSIKRFPEVHEGIREDSECLECHHPDRDPEGPPTSHPHFKGCLKCHNDKIK